MIVYEEIHETWPIVWRDGIAASLKCYLGRGLSNGHNLTTSEQIFHTVQFAKNLHTTMYIANVLSAEITDECLQTKS